MAGIQIDGVNNKIDFDDDADTSISSASDDTLVIESGGSEAMRIDSSQNVGIGTSSPTTALTVNGTITHIGGTASSTSNLTSGGLHFHDSSTSAGDIMPITFTPSSTADRARAGIGFISQAQDGAAGFAADIAFYTRGAADGSTLGTSDERMRIASDGDLFIGTTSNYDGEILRANVDGTNNIASFTSSNNGSAGQITITNSFSASASTDETATVRFGLGNGGAAMQAFKVSDTQTAANRDVGLQFKVQQDNAEAVRFQISRNGDLTATDTSIGSISDVRLKKDIEDLTYSIDTFKALKPRTFNWKNPWLHGEETNRRGFVAQELKEVDPYWVSEQKAIKKSDDILDPATYYEEGDEIPEDKKIGDIKTEATYTYKYEKGDGSDFDLLNDGSELDNIEMIAKLGKKDAMYISVIQQLIARIEALEGN